MKTSKIALISVGTTILTNIVLNTFLIWIVLLLGIILGYIKLQNWTAAKADELWKKSDRDFMAGESRGLVDLSVCCELANNSFWLTMFPLFKAFKFQSPVKKVEENPTE